MNDFIDRIAASIARQEGFFSSDQSAIPIVRNNPGNLRYAGQPRASRPFGAKAPDKGGSEPIAVFETRQSGIVALYRQILQYVAWGYSLRSLIAAWAPPVENRTDIYLTNVSEWTGIANVDGPILNLIALESIITKEPR